MGEEVQEAAGAEEAAEDEEEEEGFGLIRLEGTNSSDLAGFGSSDVITCAIFFFMITTTEFDHDDRVRRGTERNQLLNEEYVFVKEA